MFVLIMDKKIVFTISYLNNTLYWPNLILQAEHLLGLITINQTDTILPKIELVLE